MPINETQALRALEGNRTLLRQLAVILTEDAPQLVQEFSDAISARDANRARQAVHSLKGLSATFFADKEVNVFASIENAAREDDWAILDDAPGHIDHAVQDLIRELKLLVSGCAISRQVDLSANNA